MRHRKRGRRLNRTPAHRKALLRSLANSLFKSEKNRIITTLAKAKEARPFAEKLITLAKIRSLHRYRRALSLLDDEASVHRLFEEIGPRYANRPGGYTRIIQWPKNRLGDNAPQAILELVGDEETETGGKKKRRRARKPLLKRKAKREAAAVEEPAAEEEVTEPVEEEEEPRGDEELAGAEEPAEEDEERPDPEA